MDTAEGTHHDRALSGPEPGPHQHAEYRREVIDKQVELMHERDIWVRPGKDGAG